jgi:DNA repair protein RadC
VTDSETSTAELLVRILGWRGSDRLQRAAEFLAAMGGDLTILEQRLRAREVVPHLTPRDLDRLKAALALGRRVAARRPPSRVQVHGPEDVVSLMAPLLRGLPHEEFHLVILNVRNEVVEARLISRGILDASLVHPREVFAPALMARAAAVILVHNHPSGDPTPSPEDRRVTHQLKAAGDLLGIRVLDHLVIGNPGWQRIDVERSGLGSGPGSGPGSGSGSGSGRRGAGWAKGGGGRSASGGSISP